MKKAGERESARKLTSPVSFRPYQKSKGVGIET